MMPSMRTPILTCLLVLALQAGATAQTQLELNEDAAHKAKAADAQLNKAYQQVIKGLDARTKALLVKAELKWIAFRDAACASEEDQYRGGSMAQLIYWSANRRLTEARTKELGQFTAGGADPAADKELNAVYKRWLKAQTDAKARELLIKAELAWIAFRDAEADYEAARAKGSRAGSLARLTRGRTAELKDLLETYKEH
jgi:uncharacterized protein YecT (DUF1311 family)